MAAVNAGLPESLAPDLGTQQKWSTISDEPAGMHTSRLVLQNPHEPEGFLSMEGCQSFPFGADAICNDIHPEEEMSAKGTFHSKSQFRASERRMSLQPDSSSSQSFAVRRVRKMSMTEGIFPTSMADVLKSSKAELANNVREESRMIKEKLAEDQREFLKQIASKFTSGVTGAAKAKEKFLQRQKEEVERQKAQQKAIEEQVRDKEREEGERMKPLLEMVRQQRRKSVLAMEIKHREREADAKETREREAEQRAQLKAQEDEDLRQRHLQEMDKLKSFLASRGVFSTFGAQGEVVVTPTVAPDMAFCGGVSKLADDPDYHFVIGSQPCWGERAGKGTCTWHIQMPARQSSPILFGLVAGTALPELHQRLSPPLQGLLTKDMALLSLKRSWLTRACGVAVDLRSGLAVSPPLSSGPVLSKTTRPSTRAFVKLTVDVGGGTANYAIAFAPHGAAPCGIPEGSWIPFGGQISGIVGSVFPVVGLQGKGDACLLYPQPVPPGSKPQVPKRSTGDQVGLAGTWYEAPELPPLSRRGVPRPDFPPNWKRREGWWYGERQVLVACDRIQRWARGFIAREVVRRMRAEMKLCRVHVEGWFATMRGKGVDLLGVEYCDWLVESVERKRAEMAEERKQKAFVLAKKTADRVAISREQEKNEQREKGLTVSDREMIDMFTNRFATREAFAKYAAYGSESYTFSAMGSRAEVMDMREYLRYLAHIQVLPERLSKTTVITIFKAVNRGQSSATAADGEHKQAERDVHDADQQQLDFDEFFECMRRIAVRLAGTEGAEENHATKCRPSTFYHLDNKDQPASSPYVFDTERRVWLQCDKATPTVSPAASPNLSLCLSFSRSATDPPKLGTSPLLASRSPKIRSASHSPAITPTLVALQVAKPPALSPAKGRAPTQWRASMGALSTSNSPIETNPRVPSGHSPRGPAGRGNWSRRLSLQEPLLETGLFPGSPLNPASHFSVSPNSASTNASSSLLFPSLLSPKSFMSPEALIGAGSPMLVKSLRGSFVQHEEKAAPPAE